MTPDLDPSQYQIDCDIKKGSIANGQMVSSVMVIQDELDIYTYFTKLSFF